MRSFAESLQWFVLCAPLFPPRGCRRMFLFLVSVYWYSYVQTIFSGVRGVWLCFFLFLGVVSDIRPSSTSTRAGKLHGGMHEHNTTQHTGLLVFSPLPARLLRPPLDFLYVPNRDHSIRTCCPSCCRPGSVSTLTADPVAPVVHHPLCVSKQNPCRALINYVAGLG